MRSRSVFISGLSSLLTISCLLGVAEAAPISQEIQGKIVSQGVPVPALERLIRFYEQNLGREFKQDTYTCQGKEPTYLRPCEEKKRVKAERTVQLKEHEYAVIIDYSKSSMENRLYMINWKTGEVKSQLVTHGKNSGDLFSYRFSNIKDSKQTSLGIYLVGEPYVGGYGSTLRLYGLEGSNDQAYHRDIVMHGAWYADVAFSKSTNPKTKAPYGRLGVSWGCPAVSLGLAKQIFPLLKHGALLYHYHPTLEEAARTGREVVGPNLEPVVVPVPEPRPEIPQAALEQPPVSEAQ